MNEVQLFIQEVFPNASQAVIQTPEAWIVTGDENKTISENYLKFDKVNNVISVWLEVLVRI